MRSTAPGIALRLPPDESSPIGGLGPGGPRKVIRLKRTIAAICIALLACAGAASFGHGLYIHAKAQLAQILLHVAWDRTRATGNATKPWPWADTHPLLRLTAPGHDADLLVLAGARGAFLFTRVARHAGQLQVPLLAGGDRFGVPFHCVLGRRQRRGLP